MTELPPPHNTKRKNVRTLVVAGAAVGLVVLFFIVQVIVNRFKNPNQMDIVKSMTMDMDVRMPAGAMPVQVEVAKPGIVSSVVTYTGSADAYNEVPIYPRTEGWVRSLSVYSGDRVHQRQVLATLDNTELTSRVTEAQHEAQAARQRHETARSRRQEAAAHRDHYKHTIQEAKADLDYWSKEIERNRKLLQEQVISQEEFDRAYAQFKSSEAKYHQNVANAESAKSAFQAAESEVRSTKNEVDKASAALKTQQIIRGYTTITAPVSGVVMDRKIDLGILVKPEMEIMRIAQIDPIRIQVNVAMNDAKEIRRGTPVTIWKDKLRQGDRIIASITSVFARTDVNTRTTRIEAIIPNYGETILPGDFVMMDIGIGSLAQIISVPNTAIIERDQQKAVWIEKDGRAELKYVTTGSTDGQRTAIISGLSSGDRVITVGNKDLKAGDMVTSGKFENGRLVEMPKPSEASNRLDASNNFYIKKSLTHYIVSIELKKKPVQVGFNEFDIQITPMHGQLPSNLELQAKSIMPAMASMPVPEPRITKSSAGQFRMNVDFNMGGVWQVTLNLKEGLSRVATTEFLVEVK
jgi:RND family efflux transporter MFP subunit